MTSTSLDVIRLAEGLYCNGTIPLVHDSLWRSFGTDVLANALGHKLVAEIAWRQLEPKQRQAIVDTIRRHPGFDRDFVAKMDDDAAKGDKALQDHWIFLQAATWPDIIRDDKERDRPDWHYIDFPIYLADSDRAAYLRNPVNIATDYPGSVAREKYNAVQAIQLCRATLRGNAGPDVKAMANCWLFHLVGDLHQPLHCSALFSAEHFKRGDMGGNLIKLTGGENLHSRWDGLLGRNSRMSGVAKIAAELSDRRLYREQWELAAKEMDPAKWAAEGHALCESVVYDAAILEAVRNAPAGKGPEDVKLPESYNKTAGEIARKRVLTAGLRLGAMLKELGENKGIGGQIEFVGRVSPLLYGLLLAERGNTQGTRVANSSP